MINPGDKFGRLTVIERVEPAHYIKRNGKRRNRARFRCVCECGNEKIVFGESLTRGLTQSCGCLQAERTSQAEKTHGETDSKLYNVWSAIKRRCFNPNVPEYKNYGARGITMCDEWKNDYASFMKWAYSAGYIDGARRGECTIDRIDNNSGYSPENCRIVNNMVQCNNTRRNHFETYNGETHTIAEWARMYNIPYARLHGRIMKCGWPIQKALEN